MIRQGFYASIIPLTIMAGVTAVGFAVIEPGAMMARHWDITGAADRFSPRGEALLMLPALALFLAVLFPASLLLKRQAAALRASRGLYLTGWIGTLTVLAAAQAAMVWANAGGGEAGLAQLPMSAILVTVSVLLFAIGNFLGKSRPNWLVGVRNPWTLRSESAWRAANRLAGWAFVVLSLAGGGLALAGRPGASAAVLVAGALATAALATFVSWQAFRRDRAAAS